MKFLEKIEGRHWVFIVGLTLASVTSRWSPDTATGIICLLGVAGFGMFLTR